MKRPRVLAATAAIAFLHALATTGPRFVGVERPPAAPGMTVGTTVTVVILGSRLVAVLALPVGAALVGYRVGGRVDLPAEYRGLLATLAAGGAVGGALGGGLPAAAIGERSLALVGSALGAVGGAAGFAVVGFAGAAFAHVRGDDGPDDADAEASPDTDTGPDDPRDAEIDHDRYRPDDVDAGGGD